MKNTINLEGAYLSARKCDVTGKSMMQGWCWGDGFFYTATEQTTNAECRKDRDAILDEMDWKNPLSSASWDINGEEAEEYLQSVMRAMVSQDTDEDLRIIGYYRDYLYYTEWELDECDISYIFDKNGKSWDINLVLLRKDDTLKKGDIVCSSDLQKIERINNPKDFNKTDYFYIEFLN